MDCPRWTGPQWSTSSTSGSTPDPDGVNSRTTWLCTLNSDGSPHVTAVGALWMDGTFWFQTGAVTRKGRNVARDPRCTVAVSIRGADVVIEGDAVRVTDADAVTRIAQGVGGQRLAGRAGRERVGHLGPVQRTRARTAAVERLPDRAALGDGGLGGRARRPDPLRLLTVSGQEITLRSRWSRRRRARPTSAARPRIRTPAPARNRQRSRRHRHRNSNSGSDAMCARPRRRPTRNRA